MTYIRGFTVFSVFNKIPLFRKWAPDIPRDFSFGQHHVLQCILTTQLAHSNKSLRPHDKVKPWAKWRQANGPAFSALGSDMARSYSAGLQTTKELISFWVSTYEKISVSCHMIDLVPELKIKVRQFDNFVIIDGTVSCRKDNLQCQLWWQKMLNWRSSVFSK